MPQLVEWNNIVEIITKLTSKESNIIPQLEEGDNISDDIHNIGLVAREIKQRRSNGKAIFLGYDDGLRIYQVKAQDPKSV